MKTEVITLQTNENVTLTSYLLDSSNEMSNINIRPAVLIFPGGGYRACSDREAEPIAMAFLVQGYQAFILRYSLNQNAAFPKPLHDAEEALQLIHHHSADWHIDLTKIAVCGFSAGGHLAAALATTGKLRPNAAILGYPCILKSVSNILPYEVPSIEKQVDNLTPPVFIFATRNDSVVPIQNSLQFAIALEKKDIPFELHIFQKGSHGLSLAKAHTCGGYREMVNPQVEKWFELSIAWLEQIFGRFVADKELPDFSASQLTKDPPYYSIDLPLCISWTKMEVKTLILKFIPDLQENPNLEAAMSISLRQINEFGHLIDQDTLDKLNSEMNTFSFP